MVAGDANRDGQLDLAATDAHGITVLLGTGNGTFGAGTTFHNGSEPNSIVVADFNNDGKLDLATARTMTPIGTVGLGNSDGTFQTSPPYAVGSGDGLAVDDLNRAGTFDLVVPSSL
jgi:hypothetical protein